MIVELEVERREVLATRARDHGTVIVRRMLEGSIAPDLAVEQLQAHDLGTGPWRVTAWQELRGDTAAGDVSLSPLEDALAFVSWPHLHAYIDDTHLVVVEDARYESGLDLDHIAATMGASRPLTSVVRFADSFREARWALESAQAAGARSAVYGSHGSYFMPNTIAEGEVAVRRLLGPILDYDEMHDAELMKSLQVYFEANRSWQAGSRKLNIHKQTLVYRIKKIEELTGADLRDFGVQAELYLALRTWRLLGSG
jgi:purine catabolism regulator